MGHGSNSLFYWSSNIDGHGTERIGTGRPVLVVTLGGFIDAGSTRQLLESRILHDFSSFELGRFDTDQVYDYAGHRPRVIFDHDHFREFDTPLIRLHQVKDDAGSPFLLLSGPEPSFRWEAMVGEIENIIDVFNVRRVVVVQSIPSSAPHTRPIIVSRFASRPELIQADEQIPATVMMSSTFNALLTIRLGEHDIDVIGLVAHIPHYLTDAEYPPAAIALLNQLTHSFKITIPPGERLLQQAAFIQHTINEQIKKSPEIQEVLSKLEEQYAADNYHRALSSASVIDADQLGAEVEAYLQGLDNPTTNTWDADSDDSDSQSNDDEQDDDHDLPD